MLRRYLLLLSKCGFATLLNPLGGRTTYVVGLGVLIGLLVGPLAVLAQPVGKARAKDLYLGEAYYQAAQGNYFDAISQLDNELWQFHRLDDPKLDPLHYQVNQGAVKVELLGKAIGTDLTFTPVLVVDGETIVSSPSALAGATVTAKVVGSSAGPKIIGYMYKSKARNRRKWGHRQRYATVEVTGITA